MIYMKKSIKLNVLVVVCMVSILFGNLNLKNVDAKKHITLSKKSVTLKKGKMIKVRLIGAAAKKVKWRSLNKRVAVVKNGKIMAKNVGNTAVVAKYKNKNYRCSVKVVRNKIVTVPTEKPQSTHKPEPTAEPTYRPEPTVEPTRETEPTNKPQENEKTNDTYQNHIKHMVQWNIINQCRWRDICIRIQWYIIYIAVAMEIAIL